MDSKDVLIDLSDKSDEEEAMDFFVNGTQQWCSHCDGLGVRQTAPGHYLLCGYCGGYGKTERGAGWTLVTQTS